MTTRFLLTGGAGFIGINYARRLIERGEIVTIFDDLSRSGASTNLDWLRSLFGPNSYQLVVGDVRDADSLVDVARDVDVIVHLAAQVAVTTSVIEPRKDFEINALGTFNVLEAARLSGNRPLIIYASTNKVYGGMDDIRVKEADTCYQYMDYSMGIPESQPMDFHSPYGCSKGAGDQYVRDYYRIYGIPSVVFRQSCIYGPRQFGVEDQGWVAWFVIAALTGKPITIYGDGKQVRDILYIDDLLNLYDVAVSDAGICAGEVYNIGGGPGMTMSVWKEFAPRLEKLLGRPIKVKWSEWRPGDQRIYVSDIRKAKDEFSWSPCMDVDSGVEKLFNWAEKNLHLFE